MSEVTSAPCSREALANFTSKAEPGARLTYFTASNTNGYRGLDWSLRWDETAELIAVTNRVRSLYNAGLVDLVQERCPRDITRYIVIWREHPVHVGQHALLPMVDR